MMTNRAHSQHFSFLKPLSLELGHQKDGSLPGTNQEKKGPHHRLESGTGQVVDAVQGRVTIGVEEKGTVPSETVPFPSFQSLPDLLDQIL